MLVVMNESYREIGIIDHFIDKDLWDRKFISLVLNHPLTGDIFNRYAGVGFRGKRYGEIESMESEQLDINLEMFRLQNGYKPVRAVVNPEQEQSIRRAQGFQELVYRKPCPRCGLEE